MQITTTNRIVRQRFYVSELRLLRRAAALLKAYEQHATGERRLSSQTGHEAIDRLLFLEGDGDD